jgi:hypothetical protein
MNAAYEVMAERAAFRCEYCRAPAALFNFPFEIEHIVPLSRGGDDTVDNLALACRACNVFKGSFIRAVDVPRAVPIALSTSYGLWTSSEVPSTPSSPTLQRLAFVSFG